MKDILDSNLLRCFLHILDHRKLTVAAEKLCITQPALSKNLQRLENELGVQLFHRTPSGMVPTTYGVILGRRTRQIFLESLAARSEIQLMHEGGYGSIVVGTGPMWSVHAFPALVSDFIRNQPKTHIKIVSGVPDTLLPPLLKGEIDVIITSLDFPDHPDLIKEHIANTQQGVMANSSHPLASPSKKNPRDLLDYPFAGFTDDYVGLSHLEQFFASHGVQFPGLTVESNSLATLLSLLSSGDFIACLTVPILLYSKQLGIAQINLSGPLSLWRFSVGAVYRRDSKQSALVVSILQEIRAKLNV
ncbi:MAG: LysR family transcriptional regulator [Candidatus Accumulibacter sp.]|nr:LysR family transcriptional regulator [Accumulibacter sp.]